MRNFLSIFCLLIFALQANAAIYLTVEQKSGEKFNFLLADKPVITFKNGDLVVNGNAKTSYAISCVKNYHFTENDQTTAVTLGSDVVRILAISENTIGVENANALSNVILVGSNGAVLSTSTTDDAGSATVNLPACKGIYIIIVGKKAFKVIRN